MKNLQTLDEFLNESFSIGDYVTAIGTQRVVFKYGDKVELKSSKWNFKGHLVYRAFGDYSIVLNDDKGDFIFIKSENENDLLNKKEVSAYKMGWGEIKLKLK